LRIIEKKALGPGIVGRLAGWFSAPPRWGHARGSARLLPRRRLFLRLLGVVYLAAFLSLWVQVHGLIGSRGILPIGEYLAEVRAVTGPERYALVPTLCWLDAGDGFLDGLCGAGVILSGLLLWAWRRPPCLGSCGRVTCR